MRSEEEIKEELARTFTIEQKTDDIKNFVNRRVKLLEWVLNEQGDTNER